MTSYIRWFRGLRLTDVARVGGKTASLGELYGELGAAGVRVPNGFAITADAYRALLDANGLRDRVAAILKGVTGEDVTAVAAAGAELRRLVETAPLPPGLGGEVIAAYLGSGPGVRCRARGGGPIQRDGRGSPASELRRTA